MQDVINGLAQGSVYALTGMGLVLIFSVVRVPNFAHGELVMIGGMLGVLLVADMHLSIVLALAAGMITALVLGILFSTAIFSRLNKQGEVGQLIASLALVVVIQAGTTMLRGDDPRIIPGAPSEAIIIAGARVPVMWLIIFLSAVVFALALEAYVRYTATGRVMRAMALNPMAAKLMGIPIGLYQAMAFGIGSALAGIAGVLYGLSFPVQASVGASISLKAFIVIIFAGMGSITGALIGGLLLGLVESFGGSYLSSGYRDTFGFVFLLLVLLFRPNGLFAAREQ